MAVKEPVTVILKMMSTPMTECDGEGRKFSAEAEEARCYIKRL